ncbi:MAG: hypothetical protein EP298_13350 [Gammaproteobacteria bacterium]|nr:MAG: hypothetical protein EP298_13350 [Gammaproteobacteria bacterium]UTW41735.1 S1/P1 nuclease [bacterium SCSIO 12844]
MKKILVFILTIGFLSNNAIALWSTGHALVAQIAEEHLNHETLIKVNQLLNIQPDVPELNDWKQPQPSPKILYQTYNYMQGAASWPDDLKNYYWQDFSQKNNFSDMHFIGVDINLAQQGNQTYCQNTLNNQYIESFIHKNSHNIINAIESAVKTLALKTTSDSQKATALRYLIHFMGDLAQPLHTINPKLDGINTYGGNRMIFNEINTPEYNQVTGKNPLNDYTTLAIDKLHAYFDSDLAQFNQLQETMDSKYSPQGYELWYQYKNEYLAYLHYLALQTGQYTDQISPSITHWAKQSAQLGCEILITDQDSFHYQANTTKKLITITWNPKTFSQYNNKFNQQIYLNGMRLAYLLEAIYNPDSINPIIISYRKLIINPIVNNPNIVTLSELSQQ